MKKEKILFYSPLNANMPLHKIGGAEAGCKRTVEILQAMDYRLKMIAKPTFQNGPAGYVKEAIRSISQFRKTLKGNAGIVYMIGYYEKNIYLEWLLLSMAKRKQKKIIYEPKNGNLVSSYQEGGSFYRKAVEHVFRLADVRFCQGTEYVKFLRKTFDLDGVYIPNYVMDRYLHQDAERQESEQVQLVYFGRITAEKNVNLIIKTSGLLTKQGIPNTLTLIGACTDCYRKELDQMILSEGIAPEQIRFTGSMDFDSLTEELKRMDFFLFPSANKKEGHSNSLTEAMAFGVVPIVSCAGFNREIVGDQALVVEELSADKYAQAVANLVKARKVEHFREQVKRRVEDHYTETIVTARMITALNTITGK